jgi:hypothetical protein
VGHALARTLEIGIGRFRVTLVSDAMRELLRRARCWSPTGDEARDLDQLRSWLETLGRDLAALEGSLR